MPTTSSAPPDVHELVAAYRTLGLELQASSVVIRTRYRELAQLHHPDKWPPGSAEQVAAAERMREINAAYDLIEDAPLHHREVPAEPTTEPAHEAPDDDPVFETRRHSSTRRSNWLTRVDIDIVICIRFLYGLVAGGALVYWLSGHGVMQNRLYSWLVPVVMRHCWTKHFCTRSRSMPKRTSASATSCARTLRLRESS